MAHNQRLKKLLDLQKINSSKFCRSINYTLKNLSNYLNEVTENPNGELVIGILRHYPHWNIRYWLLGEGQPFLDKDQIQEVEEDAINYRKNDQVVGELMAQLAYMRKENEEKDKEIERLKNK